MATLGLIQRRDIKSALIAGQPSVGSGNDWTGPVIDGEIVFATDTKEFGFLDLAGNLKWVSVDDIGRDVPIGGTTGQVLEKASDVDGDATWKSISQEFIKDGNGYRISGLSSDTLGTNAVNLGSTSTASGDYSYAEGRNNTASGFASHAEGYSTEASGNFSHAEGIYAVASGNRSHAEGYYTIAGHNDQTAIGKYNRDLSDTLFEVGNGVNDYERGNAIEVYSDGRVHAPGLFISLITDSRCLVTKEYVDANAGGSQEFIKDGNGYRISGLSSDVLGTNAVNLGVHVTASGSMSHAEGYYTTASNDYSHVEGASSISSGIASHAEGIGSGSLSRGSHAEGYYTTASGDHSHAEGENAAASGLASHAEGGNVTASGDHSHAEGIYTVASGNHSHAGGNYTIAGHTNQTAIGTYNNNLSDTLFEVGNGDNTARSNAFEVHSNGLTVQNMMELVPISTPTTNNTIFIDSADNILKFKDSSGTVKAISLA